MTYRRVAHRSSGITLIELMVAMVLGLLVTAGIVTVFVSTSNHNQVQTQLANLQEEGRFAIARISADLRMANGFYCSNSGGVADNSDSTGIYMDGLRAPKVYAKGLVDALSDVTTLWGSASYPGAPASPYYLPAFLSMRGYECGKTTCAPGAPTRLPAAGTGFGARVIGASVLTVRYLDSSRGWAIGGVNSTASVDARGKLHSITVRPAASEPLLSEFKAGHVAMLADCSNAQIFAVDTPSSGLFAVSATGNFPDTALSRPKPQSSPRLFDLNTDLLNVTYYLQMIDNGNGQKTGALIRRAQPPGEDSVRSEEVVRGVERLDFMYAVEDRSGNTRFLHAPEVDTRAGGSIDCPTSVPNPDGTKASMNSCGCLWRAIKSIEVHILMDGQTPLYALSSHEMNYVYVTDGNTVPTAPDDARRAFRPSEQGFANSMLRREFSALISLRNYNP
ncbi:PilW family protein [Rhodanobacter sp. MP7CTX1]|uniref:PilW family protein n=1 Tax=Rhodanobacter sp. MP7CTX1 TaxID=2723084 RepID=UPI00160C0FA9|nr:PilW family protein [Rhodanobacter sp. MP7CTX1]MBB6186360.1 type IV pilus assembly protein PilW [Rhodanobacter sp. MP7CTX1]